MKPQNIFIKISGFLISCIILSYASSLTPLELKNAVKSGTMSGQESVSAAVSNQDLKTDQEQPLIQSPKQAVDFRMNVYYSNLDYNNIKSTASNITADSIEKKHHNKTTTNIITSEIQDSTSLTLQLEPIKTDLPKIDPNNMDNKQTKDSGTSNRTELKTVIEDFQYKIYPNPADLYCKIEIISDWQDKEINYRIYDQQGKYIEGGNIRSDITEINTSSYPNGVFILNLQSLKSKINTSERIFIHR